MVCCTCKTEFAKSRSRSWNACFTMKENKSTSYYHYFIQYFGDVLSTNFLGDLVNGNPVT